MYGKIFHGFHVGDIEFSVWFGVVLNLPVDLLMDISFKDQFRCGSFLSVRKVKPWRLQPIDTSNSLPKVVLNLGAPIVLPSSTAKKSLQYQPR